MVLDEINAKERQYIVDIVNVHEMGIYSGQLFTLLLYTRVLLITQVTPYIILSTRVV